MISIVIPIFNEKESLQALFQRIRQVAVNWNTDYEVILVDDGSSDGSDEIIQTFSKRDPRFRGVRLSRNFGHQAAVSAGLAYAQGEAVIIMDGDLQDPPEVIERLLEKWREGYRVVYAVRSSRKDQMLKRLLAASFYRLLSRIAEVNIPQDTGDFCLLDQRVVEAMRHEMPERIRYIRGLRAYAGFRSIGVEFERPERFAGEPKYTIKKSARLASDAIFGFSTLPLRLATYLGLAVLGVSLVSATLLVIHWVFQFEFLGISTGGSTGVVLLSMGLFFLGGAAMVFLGILGEYVGRIYIEVKRRPTFIVDQKFGAQPVAQRRNKIGVIADKFALLESAHSRQALPTTAKESK